jgi:tRNA dimethylallyltransferase
MLDEIICIVGPTASGKTGLGIELAKRINAEIISADSMQIYKGLDIATAKVTDEEAQGIKHHLIDICDPRDKYSVADFKNMCYDKIEEIRSTGKNVIVVGGTGLYISAIVNDMNFKEENVDMEYRESLYKIAREKSNEYLHDMLRAVDPESAEKIHMNNVKRVIRALEINNNLKQKKSDHMVEEERRIDSKEFKYKFKVFYISHDRDILYERINKRVDIMMQTGLIDEAKKVYDAGYDKDCTCMQAIGYKEFFPYFEKVSELEECVEKLKQETRKYAKRQITWFKNKLETITIDGGMSKEEQVDFITSNL